MQQFLNFFPLPQGQGSFRPTFLLGFGLARQHQPRRRRDRWPGPGHVSGLPAGQLFQGEQPQPLGGRPQVPSPAFSVVTSRPSQWQATRRIRETVPWDRAGNQQQFRAFGGRHQGRLFPCLDPPSSRKSRLLLCFLPQEHSACMGLLPRLYPAPRSDESIMTPVFVRPQPLSFIEALLQQARNNAYN